MCRAKNSDAGVESMDDFKDLFETPAPSLDDPLTDPVIRARIGEWISLAMSRTTHRPRRHRPQQAGPRQPGAARRA